MKLELGVSPSYLILNLTATSQVIEGSTYVLLISYRSVSASMTMLADDLVH